MGASVSGSGHPGGGLGLPPFGRVCKALAILHAAVFLVAAFGTGLWRQDFAAHVFSWLSFSAPGALSGRVWTLVTYPFLILHPLTLFFTLLFYWWFGSVLEGMLGSGRFLRFWLGSVILPPLLAWGLYGLFFGYRNPGFSLAGLFVPDLALICALAFLAPSMRLLILFILPVPIRIFAWLSVGAAAAYLLMTARWGSGFIPLTHLFAAGWAWFYLRPLQKLRLGYLRKYLGWLEFRRHKLSVIQGGKQDAGKRGDEYIH